MSHAVIIAAPVGPVLRRFDDPVKFRDYIQRFCHPTGAMNHWPKSWQTPFLLLVAHP